MIKWGGDSSNDTPQSADEAGSFKTFLSEPAALAGMKTAQLWTLFLHLSLRYKLQEALWNCNTAGQTCIPETRSWHRAVEEMPKKETPLRDAARQAPRL